MTADELEEEADNHLNECDECANMRMLYCVEMARIAGTEIRWLGRINELRWKGRVL
jgi:hypothetical protein